MPRVDGSAVHRTLAPPVVLLASALATACLVSIPDVVHDRADLVLVEPRWVGWMGAAVVLTGGVAVAVLLTGRRVGAGAGLAAGAGCAVVGLGLAHNVRSDLQVALAPVWLAVAVGALLAGGASAVWDLPRASAGRALAGWALPLAAGWPLAAWAALGSAGSGGDALAVQVPVWLLAPAAVLVIGWGLLDLLSQPVPPLWSRSTGWWDSAWVGLLVLVVGGGMLMMFVGFAGEIPVIWLRPLVVVAVVAALAGFAVVGRLLPDPAVRRGYVAVLVAMACGPSAVQLLLAGAHSGRVSAGVAAALSACACLGTLVGLARPVASAPVGLAVAAAGMAGGWFSPSEPLPVVAVGAPMLLGLGMSIAAGVRVAARDRLSLGFVAATGVAGLALGLAAQLPLGWAMTGALPVRPSDVQSVGRVVLGLSFAACVLAAALVAASRELDGSRHPPLRAANARRSVRTSSAGARSTK